MSTTVSQSEEFVPGAAGRLFTRAWLPAHPPRAVVAICHGFNSHSGYYEEVGSQFAEQGLATYALDLRGRGKSDGERFYVDSFGDYVADLHILIGLAKARHPGVPIFLLGHSAGGVIACLYALDHPKALAGLICEDFAYEVPAPAIALAILKGISHFAPHAHALALKNKDFSRDPAVIAVMDRDPLIAGERQPFATMAAIIRADQRLGGSLADIRLPIFVLHGAADRAARPSGSQHFLEQAGSADKTLKMYPDRFHDPFNDFGKEEVAADVIGWIKARGAYR